MKCLPQIIPSWSAQCNADEIATKYNFGFEYEGAGLYLTATDTCLILQDSQLLYIHVFNVPLSGTVFSGKFPIRYQEA